MAAEARDLIERLREMGAVIEPNRSVSVHRNVEYQELFLSGLRLAAGGSVYEPDSPARRDPRPDVAGRVTKYPSVDPEGHGNPREWQHRLLIS